MKKILYSIVLISVFFVGCMQTNNQLEQEKKEALLEEDKNIEMIKNSISKDDVKLLEEKNVWDDFLNEAKVEMKTRVLEYQNETLSQIKKWNLSPEDSIYSIKNKAQEYLNKNFNGIKIGSKEFEELIFEYIDSGEVESIEKSNNDSEFACLYLYMNIYKEYILDEEIQDLDDMTLEEIINQDAKENFIQTYIPILLGKYI